MKIAFNIARLNWYRILSAPIAEALRRGWEVQCWHAKDRDGLLKKNAVSINRMPKFKVGMVNVKEYEKIEGLRKLIAETDVDVIVDADTVPAAIPDLCDEIPGQTPLTVLVDAVSNPRLQNGGSKKLPRFDIFSVPSVLHLESTIKLMSRNHLTAIEKVGNEMDGWGDQLIRDMRKTYTYSWTLDDCEYYRSNSLVVGVPPLDDVVLCDPVEIRKKWGIPVAQKVVGYFPSPYDMHGGNIWGEMNYARTSFGVLVSAIRHGKVQHIAKLLKIKRDKHIVRAVRRFCDYNNAVFVAKLRHSRSAPAYLKSAVDIEIGEDGYYPHTALELCSVADVTIGFTSSAALESVAGNTPYLDIEIPYFPKELYINNFTPALSVAADYPGVISSVTADSFVGEVATKSIDEIKMNSDARKKYLDLFAFGWVGGASRRLMDGIEKRVKRRGYGY